MSIMQVFATNRGCVSMGARIKGCAFLYLLILLIVVVVVEPFAGQVYGAGVVRFGDQNVEQWYGTLGGDLIQAYTKITVTKPTTIQSFSMYLQYAGSDGSQCMKFAIYKDNGWGSPAGQPLVAFTQREYCLRPSPSWGPAWYTWRLNATVDYLTINTPGDYWLCTLAKNTYGTIYHYAYSGSYDYTYGYNNWYFSAPYYLGFPQYFSTMAGWEYNAPYSFYATGTS
jgi:hypothetical protein